MSGGAISLEKSVRTCSVNTGEANRIQSDRFFNPTNMVCIPWNGLNNKGQEVSPDSFYTKTPGCDSSLDRILVENGTSRPRYYSYVTLNAAGLEGDIYGVGDDSTQNEDAVKYTTGRKAFDDSRNKITGNFGTDFGAKVAYQSCTVGAYERNTAMMNQQGRQQNYLQNGFIANQNRQQGGY